MSRSPLERRLERLSARCASRRPFVFPRGVVCSDASGLAFTSPSVASPAHRRAGSAHLSPLSAADPHLYFATAGEA